MSTARRKGEDYTLPGASRAGIPQELQLRKHEGFTPEAITPKQSRGYVVGDGPEMPFVATPADWTEDALCIDDWELFDSPREAVFKDRVKPICDRCPVRETCLAEAFEQEVTDDGRPLPANLRHTVRGGMLPKERAMQAKPITKDMECHRGHRLIEVGASFDSAYSTWRCKQCLRERDQEQADCPLCGKTVGRKGIQRHMRGAGCKREEKAA